MDEIITCLEQKVILLTQIWDLTKQIEMRCTQSEIELDDFLDRRGVYIARVNKCTNLIHSLTEKLPTERQKRMKQILELKITENDCNSEDELRSLKLSKECVTILQKAAALDKSAREEIQKQCDELRVRINELRKNESHESMYRNIT